MNSQPKISRGFSVLFQLSGLITCATLSLTSCAEMDQFARNLGGPSASPGRPSNSRSPVTPGAQAVIGTLIGSLGPLIGQQDSRTQNIIRGIGAAIALHALYRYSADSRQRETAQSKAQGRPGTYYVRVPPKKGYSGPRGTHLVPYKNGAIAGDVKVVQSNPTSGQKVSIGGTQGTVL